MRQNLAVLNAGSTRLLPPEGPYVNGARPKISVKSSVLNAQTVSVCPGAPAVSVQSCTEKLPTYILITKHKPSSIDFTDYKALLIGSET